MSEDGDGFTISIPEYPTIGTNILNHQLSRHQYMVTEENNV